MKDHPFILSNVSSPAIQPIRAQWCGSFLSKLRGYTFHRSLSLDEGKLLVERRDSRVDTSIHMMFVWTDLAVIWINSENEVVDTVLAKAWRPFYASARPARYILEIHPTRHGEFKAGDRVEFKHD
ncbi:MAG: hypothetical protein EHM81_02265 [Chloroflexi bacterium]|nr:MAG: hypothetical protein EHM81_02265 [Chloroflexota bacterium]